jgi:hypothetical protein
VSKQKRPRIMYVHTIDDMPARFDGEQICYVSTHPNGRFHARPVPDLATIRREQRASIQYRKRNGFSDSAGEYGYVRVELPDA